MPDRTELIETVLLPWSRDIFWAGCAAPWPGCSDTFHLPPEWNERAALGALRQSLNEPAQSGVLEELQVGLSQLAWDTPSASGRRLISALIWDVVLARFGVSPTLRRHSEKRRLYAGGLAYPLSVHVIDAHEHDHSERTGWQVVVRLDWSDREPDRAALEWTLNALLQFDVELGLAPQPLYRRRHRPEDAWAWSHHKADEPVERTGSPHCPKCGKAMVERANERSGNPFWGCPDYPLCNGKRNWRTGAW